MGTCKVRRELKACLEGILMVIRIAHTFQVFSFQVDLLQFLKIGKYFKLY